jgi:hypothetical protein
LAWEIQRLWFGLVPYWDKTTPLPINEKIMANWGF